MANPTESHKAHVATQDVSNLMDVLNTSLKFNMEPEKGPFEKGKTSTETSFFGFHVSFWGCKVIFCFVW